MTRRTLGKTTLTASRIGLGCATFGREIGQAESFTVLDHAIASGINVLDTAEAYGGGQSRQARRNLTGVDDPLEATDELHSSELILGRWLVARGGRERVIVQTKVLPPLSKQRVLASIDASLARLRTDFIDLFLFHAPDPQTPMQESLEAIQSAMRAGKIRSFGACNFSAPRVCEMNRAAEGRWICRRSRCSSRTTIWPCETSRKNCFRSAKRRGWACKPIAHLARDS